MAIAKNGFQKYHDEKNSLIVRVRGLTSQLFSITVILKLFACKTNKRK
jgi:hypothetical protein